MTRRTFALRAAAAGAVASLTEAAFAQRALVGGESPADTAWLNANENPEGPPPAALEAIARAAPGSWRYHFQQFRGFYAALARAEELEPGQVLAGAGSTEVLNFAVAAFTSPARPLVSSEPTFEAPGEMARALGHAWRRAPLTSTYAADVRRLAEEAARAGGGLIYICNPNNPTSSLTPARDLDWLAANLPRDTVLLVDEAYIHFLEDYQAASALRHVREERNVVVCRSFSKIYGMAGLRVGFACARPELIGRMSRFRNNVISIVSARAVEAALADRQIVPQRRVKLNQVRDGLCEWLRGRGLRYIEPSANFVMIETGRHAGELGSALLRKGIAVGRPFPPLEKMLRVTIGAEREMAKFKQALMEVL